MGAVCKSIRTSPRGILQERNIYRIGWEMNVSDNGATDEYILDGALGEDC